MSCNELVRPINPSERMGQRLVELSTYVATGENVFADCFDIAESVLGEAVPQGAQFAYLFRRFGNPNRHWDPDGQLVAYLLTTTRDDMLLKIVPYADGSVPISFVFLVPHEVAFNRRDWEVEEIHRHNAAFMDWIEAEGRVPEWAADLAEKMSAAGWPSHPDATGWRRMMAGLQMVSNHPSRKDDPEDKAEARRWYASIRSEYDAMHPTPKPRYRKPDIASWDADDPMKPYAEAMVETLRDLLRPTWIGDCPITIRGPIDEDDDSIDEMEEAPAAPSSGHAVGLLGNIDPAAFSRLQATIMRLDSDPVAAMTRACEILNREAEPTESVSGEDDRGRSDDREDEGLAGGE